MYRRAITLTEYNCKHKTGPGPRNTNEGQGWGPGNINTRFRLPNFTEWLVEDALTNELQFAATANSGYTFIEFEFTSYPVSTKRQIGKIVIRFW